MTEEQTFTQEDVTAAATRAAAEAERKARQRHAADLEAKLGGKSIDDILAAAKAIEEADEANKTEAQRKLAEAEKREQAAIEREAAAAKRIAEANARAALIDEGMPKETLSDGIDLLKVDPTDEEADIAAKVEALKTRLPALFTTTGDGSPPPPGVNPPRQKPPAGGKTPQERAAERKAKARPVLPASAA